eukprot:TRINITY_DN6154_c0_g1_i1.p1 TRINITY_DN6154_c0_g1~~TRINITY_DN6154_c0_g1_i1.p1  ORF type:complete len:511 (-),score=165.85 TRINITY_DN6154_c0_g1_i1:34-1566(-)
MQKTEVQIGQSLHYAADIIEGLFKGTPELENDVRREDLSIFKTPLPKLEGIKESEVKEKTEFKELEIRLKQLKGLDEAQIQKMGKKEIEELFEKARDLYRDLEKMAKDLEIKKNEMEDRYIKREQDMRARIKEREEEIGKKGGLDQLSDKKMVGDIRGNHKALLSALDDLQGMTEKALEQERNIIKTFFQGELMKLQEEFDKQKEDQATTSEGQKEDEKELKTNLELVTGIAQHIDSVNKKLSKRKDELKIEVKAQDNDNVMLQKQLNGEKGRNKKLEAELEKLKKIAAEAKIEYDNSEMGKEELGISQEKVSNLESNSKILPKSGAETSAKKITRESKYQLPASDDKNKVEKYEALIAQLRKRIDMERGHLRQVKTMYTKEIETRLELEQLLRKCVDDVKAEISSKRAENRVLMHSSHMKKRGGVDEAGLTQEDREKIIEVLLSQERVLTLLYDKTFPPRALLKQGEGMANLSTYDLEELLEKEEEEKKDTEQHQTCLLYTSPSPRDRG